MADSLQRRQHFADHGAAAVERSLDAALVVVERRQARLRSLDLGLDAAQPRRGIDQVLVELAAIGADLLDLALEGGFGVGRFALRLARRLELLVVLLERVEALGLVVWRCRLRIERPGERERQGQAQSGQQRQARIAAHPPKANHFGQVTPAVCDGKLIVDGQAQRRPPGANKAADYDQIGTAA
ncbi:MAG TPA: hypothetical protein VFB31_08485 [Pseudolabrys sp.]|nr:hypothetical protein [Pseudolabrys sp.]